MEIIPWKKFNGVKNSCFLSLTSHFCTAFIERASELDFKFFTYTEIQLVFAPHSM